MQNAAVQGQCVPRVVIFTDLDGTLLDHDTYRFEAAQPALERIRRSGIPLVFCTSKTAAETIALREAIGNADPFITENGGGVFIPEHYFPFPVGQDRRVPGYLVLDLGTPYARLAKALTHLAGETGLRLRGFASMAPEEVARLCGFSVGEARLALARDYDEPFILEEAPGDAASWLPGLETAAAARGLTVTAGGRFFHLAGASDKGRAVVRLLGLFQKKHGPVYSIALGDSANDAPLLLAADCAVLVRKKDGSSPGLPPGLRCMTTERPGPAGWCEAVTRLLDRTGGTVSDPPPSGEICP